MDSGVSEGVSKGFPGGSVVKNPPANAGDEGLVPGWGRSPRAGNGNPLQYSCLGNPMERVTCRAAVHGGLKTARRNLATGHMHIQCT